MSLFGSQKRFTMREIELALFDKVAKRPYRCSHSAREVSNIMDAIISCGFGVLLLRPACQRSLSVDYPVPADRIQPLHGPTLANWSSPRTSIILRPTRTAWIVCILVFPRGGALLWLVALSFQGLLQAMEFLAMVSFTQKWPHITLALGSLAEARGP